MISNEVLKERQNWTLERKIQESKERIREWYEAWDGQVYVSFSGGKDSTVLLGLVRRMYPEVPAVFADTGLEYPEIKEHVKKYSNVETMRPKLSFHKVIAKYGYPAISKKISRTIRDLKIMDHEKSKVCQLYLTGYTSKGYYSPSFKLPKKWYYLIDAPFMLSEKCCDVMKKEPFKRYEKYNKRVPFIGTLSGESSKRRQMYKKYGCNSFDTKKPTSLPLSFWTETDILRYLYENNISIPSVYGCIIKDNDRFKLTGVQRTGCMFCMFGVHMEKEPNRFQQMKITHPKHWDYCINKLGCGKVLDYIGVPYE